MMVQGRIKFSFRSKLPDISCITAEILKLHGLTTFLEPTNTEDDDLREFDYLLYYPEFPLEKIQIYAYKPGEIKKIYDTEFLKESKVEGMDETESNRNIYILTYANYEITLLSVVELFLEMWGGVTDFPLTQEEKNIFSTPITFDELLRRRTDSKWFSKALKGQKKFL